MPVTVVRERLSSWRNVLDEPIRSFNEAVAHLCLSLIGVGLSRVASAVKRLAVSAVSLSHGAGDEFPDQSSVTFKFPLEE